MTKEDWIKQIKLTRYKSLCYKCNTNAEFFYKLKLEKELLDNYYTKEELNNILKSYFNVEIFNIKKIIEEKSKELMLDIKKLLNNNEKIETKDYVEIYYRIEQILAYGIIGAQILTDEEYKAKIEHLIKKKSKKDCHF